MSELLRNPDPACLHPVFREKSAALLAALEAEGFAFRLFEGFRSPERQQRLYAQGRTLPGAIVTKARPWTSYHQYGLAGDFVIFAKGNWSWEAAGEKAGRWRRLHEIGRQLGLEPLSFELPHLQMAGLRIEDLAAGQYPDGGNASWKAAMDQAKESWRRIRAA